MDYKYISQLLDCYWQCETSLEEEEILRAFFSQKDVPVELSKYRALFAYAQNEVKDDVLGADKPAYNAMLDDLYMMMDWNIANGPNAAKNWTDGISMMTIKNNKMDERIKYRSKLDMPKSFIEKWSK